MKYAIGRYYPHPLTEEELIKMDFNKEFDFVWEIRDSFDGKYIRNKVEYLGALGEVVIREEVEQLFEDSLWIGYTNTINWLGFDGEVLSSKVMVHSFKNNTLRLKDHKCKVRANQLSALTEKGKENTYVGDKVGKLFSHYYSEKAIWEQEGTNELYTAILTETNQTIIDILNRYIDETDTYKIKDIVIKTIS